MLTASSRWRSASVTARLSVPRWWPPLVDVASCGARPFAVRAWLACGLRRPEVGDHGTVQTIGAGSGRAEVVLMCGVAGSGKTTCAQVLERAGYVRLSIDEEVWARFGRYGVDYDPDRYAEHSECAEATLRRQLDDLVRRGRDVVVDFSFWQRRTRDRYKKLVEAAGGRWRLVYLQVPAEVLRRRLAQRAGRFDANAAFPIDDTALRRFLGGFEVPVGEGEEVIRVAG